MPFRGFIAVEVGPLPPLLPLLDELRATGADLKVVAPENLHLTLKFLGDVSDERADAIVEAVRGACQGQDPFTMRLTGMGTFPPRGAPRVVWVGLEGAEPLEAIARALEERLLLLGYPAEDRPFRAHVTLARARSPQGKGAVIGVVKAHERDELGAVEVRDVRLMRSELSRAGPTYSVVASVPLEG